MNGAALLEFLVSIPSVSGNERDLAERLSAMLRADGFAVEREGHNLWFSLGTSARPHLLFLSHIDTVPACDGWTSDPHTPLLVEGKISALGANDAKGCVAAMIMAAHELVDQQLDGKVTFAFVVEEERGGDGIRATKPKLGVIDAAIVGEPTGLQICTAQRGMLILHCTAHGEAAHVAHASLGENAIHKAVRDIARLAEMRFPADARLGETRVQVTQITGGLARNQVPDRCEFFADLRTTPNLDHAEVSAAVDAALESEVVVHSSRYEPVATDEGEAIVEAALAAATRRETIGSATASDWAFLKGIPTVKVGPGDTQRSHRPNEYLTIAELEAGAAFYGKVVREYFARVAKEVAHA